MENTPLIKFIRNHIWDSSGVFSISSPVKILMISLISSLSLKLYLNLLVYDQNIFSSSLKVFGNPQKFSENVQECFENGLKSLENRQKLMLSSVCLYNNRTQYITHLLEDMNFSFLWQERYLTCSLRSLVRYCSRHSNIKFIFSWHHVLFSIYLPELTAVKKYWILRYRGAIKELGQYKTLTPKMETQPNYQNAGKPLYIRCY